MSIDQIEDELERLCIRLKFEGATGLKVTFTEEGFKAKVSIQITDTKEVDFK